jgi:hypothetical protein
MTATLTAITTPGVYDIPADAYHADPVPGGSLSSSGARLLLPPSCPALFKHWRDHGQPPKAAFDFGHAAHQLVLGEGPETVVVDAPDWRTNAAKAQRDEAYATGKVPLLRHDYDHVVAMADALFEHPLAAALLDPAMGDAEQSMFWTDPPTGVWLRARLDWYRHRAPGRLLIPDYKTTDSAATEHVQRDMHKYGYYIQAAFYRAGANLLGAGDDAEFLLIAQEKTPPYLVNVVAPDENAVRIGERRMRQAIETYAECTATGRWPGYSDDVEYVSLPAWVERQYEGTTW